MKTMNERKVVIALTLASAIVIGALLVGGAVAERREYPGRFSIAFEDPVGAGGEVVIMNGSPSRRFTVTVLSGGVELGSVEAVMLPGQRRIYVSAEAIAGTTTFPDDVRVRVSDETGVTREISKIFTPR